MALAQHPLVNEYAELKRRVRQKGLLKRQPTYYTYKFLNHETDFRQSYREIFQHLYQVSAPLRDERV